MESYEVDADDMQQEIGKKSPSAAPVSKAFGKQKQVASFINDTAPKTPPGIPPVPEEKKKRTLPPPRRVKQELIEEPQEESAEHKRPRHELAVPKGKAKCAWKQNLLKEEHYKFFIRINVGILNIKAVSTATFNFVFSKGYL